MKLKILICISSLRIVACLAAAEMAVGCAPREIPPRYFVASATIERKPAVMKEDDIQKVVSWAGYLLENQKAAVAFLPPSWCTTAGTGSSHSEWEQQECLSLTAELEKRAATIGYRVVDWRKLAADPYSLAKQSEVKLIFVMDDISLRRDSLDHFRISDISFEEQVSVDMRAPADILSPTTVTARCKGAARARQRRKSDQDTMSGISFSLKMISVADGTALWFYRHSAGDGNRVEKETQSYYYLSEGTKKTKTSKIAWGTAALALGVATAATGAHLNEDGTSFAQRNLGFGLAWVSVIPLTVGIVMTAVGVAAQVKHPIYQTPDEVLCARPPVTENPYTSPPASDSKTNTGPSGATDPIDPKDTSLLGRLADHFFETLLALSQDQSSPPPAPKNVETKMSDEDAVPRVVIIKRDEKTSAEDQTPDNRKGGTK